MKKHIAERIISEHPNLQGVQRKVIVFAFIPNSDNETLRVQYRIEHSVNDEIINVQPVNPPEWIINNNQEVAVRNLQTLEPIIDEETQEQLRMNGWDYFYEYAWENACPISLKSFFEFYILSLDLEDQFFNFY